MKKKPVLDFSFGVEFQEEMLALMLVDMAFAMKVVKYIPVERLYSDSHKYLFDQIRKKIEKDNALLTYVEVEDHLKTVERSKRRMIKNFVKRVYTKKVAGEAYIKEVLTDYAKKNAFIDMFMTSQTFWNSKEYEKSYEYTQEGIKELYGISFNDDATISIEDFETHRQIYVNESTIHRRRIPTNIEILDIILNGGIEKGELGIQLAEAKKGKSISLIHFGATALMMRTGRVAHFLLEGTTEQGMFRYQTRLTRIPYWKIVKDILTPEEQKRLDDIKTKYTGRLDLIPMNKHWSYTVYDIEAKLQELINVGRKPDLVVIDYGDLLKTEEKHREKRHEQTEVYRMLKQMAVMHQVPIWTAAQAVRPKDNPERKYLLRAKDVAENYEKVRIADIVCTLNQTPKEKEDGLLRYHVDLYRSADADRTVTLLVDFERMIFSSKLYGSATKMDHHEWMDRKKR